MDREPSLCGGTYNNTIDMDEFFYTHHTAEEIYERYIGQDVVVFFEDMKGTSRRNVGRITGICGDVIHMDNPQTGWIGSINCSMCRIANVSSLAGWGEMRILENK